ncbi:ABC transporter substrate-binding protein [Pseudonocardia lutea]|uniref:ABC transporter substrate-binding protein n=1 Tax=Pseudonocardia lutea TaxID=2172015 RepID=A0ABW1IFR8_9PSEU
MVAVAGCGGSATEAPGSDASVSTGDGLVIDEERIADKALFDAAAGGSVDFYSTSDAATEERVIDRFTQQTGIPVTLTRLTSAKMEERVRSEVGAGRFGADVLRSTDPLFIAELAAKRALVPWSPPSADELTKSGAMQPGDPGITSLYGAYALAFNNRVVTPEDAPASWSDLTDAKWAGGKLGLVRPTAAAAAYADLGLRNFGPDFWPSVAANSPRIFDSVSVQSEALARGEIAVAIFPVSSAFAAAEQGAPIQLVIPEDVGVAAFPVTIGLTQTGANNPAAKVFLNWLMSRSTQQFLAGSGIIPARSDVSHAEGRGQAKLPAVGTPQLQVFTMADQQARRSEVIATWNKAFHITTTG